MSYLDHDTTRTYAQLLADVAGATYQTGHPGLPFLPASCLLVKVAEEASGNVRDLKEQIVQLNTENGKLQGKLLWLTVATVILAVVQVVVAVLAYVRPPH